MYHLSHYVQFSNYIYSYYCAAVLQNIILQNWNSVPMKGQLPSFPFTIVFPASLVPQW